MAAAGFFVVAALAVTFPLILHLTDTVMIDLADPLLNSWILAWDAHALASDPVRLYDANIYFPFPQSLTYSEAILTGSLLVAPINVATHNAVLSYNLLTLACLWLAGFGTYLLVLELTRHRLAAVIAGCIFAFCPYVHAQLVHVQLLQIGWLPLALLFLGRALRQARTRDYLFFALCCVCLALASFYLMYLAAVAIGTYLSAELLWARARWPLGTWLRLAGVLALLVVCVVPFGLPYARTQQLFHVQWSSQLLHDLSATFTDLLSVLPDNRLYGLMLSRFQNAHSPAEHALFPGLTVTGLALVGAVQLRNGKNDDRREIARYLWMAAVALVLALGPVVRVPRLADMVPLPYAVLYQIVPGFAALRVPARFAFVVMLALAVLAGFGIKYLDLALMRRSSSLARRAALAGVAGLTLLELVPASATLNPIETGSSVPTVYAWLSSQDPAAVVAELPATPSANFRYVYLSTYHWHPLVNGTSGFNPPESDQLWLQLNAFPESSAVDTLQGIGVRYVVVHREALDDRARRALDDVNLAQANLSIAAAFGSDVVYEVGPRRQDTPLQGHARLELPTEVARGVAPSAVLSIRNDTPHVLTSGTPPVGEVEATVDGATRTTPLVLPIAVWPGGDVTRAVPLAVSWKSIADDQAQVQVRTTGPIELAGSSLLRVIDLPTSAQKAGLRASVTRVHLPPSIHTGQTIQIDVVARNTGEAVWLADTGLTTGAIGVAVRGWFGDDGYPAAVAIGTAAHLDWNVNPGQEAVFTLMASPATTPGSYSLVLDMLSENVTWFEDVGGGARTVLPVTVDD